MKKIFTESPLPFHYIRSMSVHEFLEFIKNSNNTLHFYDNERRNTCLSETAKPIENFIAVIDKEHKNGPEVHALFSDGSIRIYNYYSHKFITVLMARPKQAKRIMDKKKCWDLPNDILNMCLDNQYSGKNCW